MDPILEGLNFAQRTAVASPSPVLQVLAPPGSGKTKTLTARVAYTLSHSGYRPEDVICCTFTIKASREMRERLAKLVGAEVQSKLLLGTFHSICRRYLARYGYLIGLPRGFGIVDSGDSLAIIKVCIEVMLLLHGKLTMHIENHQAAQLEYRAKCCEVKDLTSKSPWSQSGRDCSKNHQFKGCGAARVFQGVQRIRSGPGSF